MQMDKLDEAEKNYKRAIKKKPDLSEAYNNLAWLYYIQSKNLKLRSGDIEDMEELKEAESLVLKALELKPLNKKYQDTLKKIRESKNGL